MKALERPQHDFFIRQASATPKKVDRYNQWLKQQDTNLVEYIRELAETTQERMANNLPIKHPKLKGFEARLYSETLELLKKC